MNIIVKTYDQLTTRELYEILKSRFWVFVMEQQCFYLDMDNTDYKAVHIMLWDEHNVEQTEQGPNTMPIVAYARIYSDAQEDEWRIGRVLALKRKCGLGAEIMQAAIEAIKLHKGKEINIDAQCQAIPFYEKIGFQVVSEPFDEAGIEHVKMKLDI